MKYLLLPFLAISSITFGQITLTDQNFAGPSQTYIFSTLTDPAIDYTTTGANLTWDFSTMVPQSQRNLVTFSPNQLSGLSLVLFGNFASINYRSTYFNSSTDLPIDQVSTVLPISIEELNGFTRITPSAVTSIGYELKISGQGIGFRSDTIETRYQLPMTFGNSYQSRGYTELDLNPIYDAKWRQYRQRASSVDGWGVVKTPFGQFDALRIHHEITELDSIYITVQGFSFWVPVPLPKSHEYEWRSTSDKESVMKITTSEIGGNETVTAIEYRDNFNGLGLKESELAVSVYPNPVVNEIHVSVPEIPNTFVIVDASGRVWNRIPATSLNQTIDVSQLPNGNYSLVVLFAEGFSSSKFIK